MIRELLPAGFVYLGPHIQIKSNQIFICSNERSEKIDNNNSDIEQDSKVQEVLTA